MRFDRYGHHPFRDTPRKRAAVLRKQRLERESLPLFADLVARDQPCVDTVMATRRRQWDEFEQRDRDRRAAKWREARRKLASYSQDERARLLHFWNAHRWAPGNPVRLLTLLNMFDHGRLDLEAPGQLSSPWPRHPDKEFG